MSASKIMFKGIDVSAYNQIDDYAKVAADGIDFAIIKIITRSGNPDRLFETHWKGFEDNGIVIQGVYNYSYATTVAQAQFDANVVVKVLNGRKAMVWLDVEDECQKTLGHLLVDIINAYAEIIYAAGLDFGIYTGQWYYNTYLKPYVSELIKYPFWVARYVYKDRVDEDIDPALEKFPEIGVPTYYGWQYTSKGMVDGIPGAVDLDAWFVDFEADAHTCECEAYYLEDGFRKELAELLGLPVTSTAEEVLAKTVTISTKKNKNHKSVTALERLLMVHGYYNGDIEADLGRTPSFGNGMNKATRLYQTNVSKDARPDGEWTTGQRSYKTALHLM